MQRRKSLRRCPTSQHRQAKTNYQHRQEEQDMETAGTRTHRQISGMVQVNHVMLPFQLKSSFSVGEPTIGPPLTNARFRCKRRKLFCRGASSSQTALIGSSCQSISARLGCSNERFQFSQPRAWLKGV